MPEQSKVEKPVIFVSNPFYKKNQADVEKKLKEAINNFNQRRRPKIEPI